MRIEDVRQDMRVELAEPWNGERFGKVFAGPCKPYRLKDTVLVCMEHSKRLVPVKPQDLTRIDDQLTGDDR